MPLLLLERFHSYISRKYFYTLGVKTARNSFTILFTSLFLICFISYPVLLNNTNTYSLPSIDGHIWQYSPHLHSYNGSSSFSIQQIRVMSLTKEALNKTLSIYQAISISSQFKHICATTSQHQCISHSILSMWDYNQQFIEKETNIIETINRNLHKKSTRTGISLHPYSTLGNVKIDHNRLVSADSFILTFMLKNTENALVTWNQILHTSISRDLSPIDIEPCKLQFKLKLLPNITKSTYIHIIMFLFMSLLLVILFQNQFSRSRIIKSRTGLGLASIFLSLACFTLTTRLFQWTQRDIQIHPWFLKLFICTTTTVEHIFFITAAVIEREKKEVSIKEKVGKGLQQTAIPIFVALILKASVLIIGGRTDQGNIRDFCLFGLVAISISFVLSLTVFTAILSIDIRRAELTDLNNDDFQISKKSKKEAAVYPQVDKNANKKRNTRRAVNTLIFCIILLYLNLFSTNISPIDDALLSSSESVPSLNDWQTVSNQFWGIMNPFYDTQSFDIYPPAIVTTDSSVNTLLQSYYQRQFNLLRQALSERTHQYNALDILHPYFIFTPHHMSNATLFIILVLIILWMIPSTRETIMLPTFRKVFVLSVTFLLRVISKLTLIKTDTLIRKVESDYDENGMHVGALSMQSQYNRLQNLERIGHITVKTLLGQHLSDIRALGARHDELVSIDQTGKLVVWNAYTQQPVACLGQQHARCMQINTELIAAGFDDGRLCVWSHRNHQLLHELTTPSYTTHIELPLHGTLISVHRNGDLCEWKDGHLLHNTSTNAHILHSYYSEPYLLTSTKEGRVVCWDVKTWQQRYVINNNVLITSLASQRLRQDEPGVLVTGSDDGAVKVWDLDTGVAVCTLSKGGVVKKESGAEEVGGPLMQFSTVARHDQPKTSQVDANHEDAICQVVVTRISNPAFEEGVCPACHTRLSSGFFIASCAMDGLVHVWRLDRVGGYTGCVHCAKDYHPRKHHHRTDDKEQWQPLFLGKLNQEGGHCLVLFDTMVLAGIRRVQERWEAWFTSLQYFEPSALADDWTIPSIACDLEEVNNEEENDDDDEEMGVVEYLLHFAFGVKKVMPRKTKVKPKEVREMQDGDMFELLPFSSVRHLWQVDETSFCCDYGNFIKLVSFHHEDK